MWVNKILLLEIVNLLAIKILKANPQTIIDEGMHCQRANLNYALQVDLRKLSLIMGRLKECFYLLHRERWNNYKEKENNFYFRYYSILGK